MKRIFDGVDEDVLDDLRWADLVTYDFFEGAKITDTVGMFRFIMRRAFPAKEKTDE
jgi:hypothetical protein